MTENFSKLHPQTQTIVLTIPMYLPSTQNPDAETEQQAVARQDRFLKLPKAIRFKLASFEIGNKIEAIGRKYGFELLRLANITRLIREYYFGEVRFEDFAEEIEKRMSVSPFTAQEIARYLKQEIIDWDPYGKYIAGFTKMTVREIVQNHPKLSDVEITDGDISIKNSDEAHDPTIKNWIQDYISHLGYAKHSQMDRTQYIFHSENGKNLSSPDREKLGIILRSFDENIPLPVDEENGEIVFDGLIPEPASPAGRQRTVNSNQAPTNIAKPQTAPAKQESFIKPYPAYTPPTPQSQRQTSPQPSPYKDKGEGARPASPALVRPPQNFIKSNPIPQSPQEIARPNFITQPNRQVHPEIDKYFNAPESPDIPSIKVHSITEHNDPRAMPQAPPPRPNIQRVAPAQPAPTPRPKYKIIDPFSGPRPEPREMEISLI